VTWDVTIDRVTVIVMERKGALGAIVAKALRSDADIIDVEYKDGYEEVFAMRSGVSYGIARFRSSSPEGSALRKELYGLTKRKQRIVLDDMQYELRTRVYDSFGEDTFQIRLRRV